VQVPTAWRPQFICNDEPQNINVFQRTDLSELAIWILQLQSGDRPRRLYNKARHKTYFFFHLSIFTRNIVQLSHSATLFFSCRHKLQHTVNIDFSRLTQMSLNMSIIIKKTLKLLSCSFRSFNTNLNLNSNLEHWKLWTRMYRPRFIDTDWPQSISRLQEEEPSNPFIWFLLFHRGNISHRQHNYV
jgi:hypothetical protein